MLTLEQAYKLTNCAERYGVPLRVPPEFYSDLLAMAEQMAIDAHAASPIVPTAPEHVLGTAVVVVTDDTANVARSDVNAPWEFVELGLSGEETT